jgi:hypothetical protein
MEKDVPRQHDRYVQSRFSEPKKAYTDIEYDLNKSALLKAQIAKEDASKMEKGANLMEQGR